MFSPGMNEMERAVLRGALRHVARDQAKQLVFMEIAQTLSKLGTCPRKAVGAVIVRDGRCISWGYNGAPPGFPHCEDNHHGWQMHPEHAEGLDPSDVAEMEEEQIRNFGCRNATHAEANALAFAAKQGISTAGGELYVTVAPCDTCSKLLIASGIRRVYFREEYRDPSGIEVLHLGGVGAVQLPRPEERG